MGPDLAAASQGLAGRGSSPVLTLRPQLDAGVPVCQGRTVSVEEEVGLGIQTRGRILALALLKHQSESDGLEVTAILCLETGWRHFRKEALHVAK